MGKFTVIPQDTFKNLQLEAGVLLKEFDPSSDTEPTLANIITATSGGITVSCVPTFSDFGEDVDNVPANMMEYKHLDSWECTISTTSIELSPEMIAEALGCAEYDSTTGKIVPRRDLEQTDFKDIWWVGDRADGGFVAVCLKNALSTAGFAITTSKNSKGNYPLTYTGHVSVENQTEMPMEFYSIDP